MSPAHAQLHHLRLHLRLLHPAADHARDVRADHPHPAQEPEQNEEAGAVGPEAEARAADCAVHRRGHPEAARDAAQHEPGDCVHEQGEGGAEAAPDAEDGLEDVR